MNENEKLTPAEKPLDETKKAALLRYLGIMFVVAFVFVLISMFSELRSNKATILELNQSSTSALTKVDQLQNDYQQMTADNAYLQGRIEELEKQLLDAEAELEEAETTVSEQQTQLNELDRQLTEARQETADLLSAYEQLLQAKDLTEAGSDASGILDGLKENVKYFAEYALNIYENLTNKGE